MFSVGDWIYLIKENCGAKEVTSAMFLAESDIYTICHEYAFHAEYAENMEEIIYACENEGMVELLVVLTENTFATEQEAREVLEVVKSETNFV